MDSHGNSIHEKVMEESKKKFEDLIKSSKK